ASAGTWVVDRQKREKPYGDFPARPVQEVGKDKVSRSTHVASGHCRSSWTDHRDDQPHHHRTGTSAAGCTTVSSNARIAEPSVSVAHKKLRSFSLLATAEPRPV